MVVIEILNQIKRFLDGEVDPEEFSFDFPLDLIDAAEDLERENNDIAFLLREELPFICANYEPDDVARKGEADLLNTNQFKAEVNKVYKQALKLIKT